MDLAQLKAEAFAPEPVPVDERLTVDLRPPKAEAVEELRRTAFAAGAEGAGTPPEAVVLIARSAIALTLDVDGLDDASGEVDLADALLSRAGGPFSELASRALDLCGLSPAPAGGRPGNVPGPEDGSSPQPPARLESG